MVDAGDKQVSEATRAFLQHLESQGFFRQMKEVEVNLAGIAEQLSTFAKTASQRLEETESMAAHILALQSIVAVLMRRAGGDDPLRLHGEVMDEIKSRTAQLSGNPEGSPAVRSAASSLLAPAGTGRG